MITDDEMDVFYTNVYSETAHGSKTPSTILEFKLPDFISSLSVSNDKMFEFFSLYCEERNMSYIWNGHISFRT